MEFRVFSDTLTSSLMPIVIDGLIFIGKITFAQGVYYWMRRDRKAGIETMKYVLTGYVLLKCMDLIFELVDTIVANVII